MTHGEKGYPQTDSPEAQHRLIQRLCEKITKNTDKILKMEKFLLDDAEVAVIAYGIPSRGSLNAVKKSRKEGIKAGLVRILTVWPFPEKEIQKLARRVKALVVPEMNYGQLVYEVERVAKETPVHFLPKLGEPHKPTEILKAIRRAVKK